MAIQVINVGTVPNDGTGSTVASTFVAVGGFGGGGGSHGNSGGGTGNFTPMLKYAVIRAPSS